MTQDEQKEQLIQLLSDDMRTQPFRIEFQVKKKPSGIKVIYEVTQEEMDAIMKKQQDSIIKYEK